MLPSLVLVLLPYWLRFAATTSETCAEEAAKCGEETKCAQEAQRAKEALSPILGDK